MRLWSVQPEKVYPTSEQEDSDLNDSQIVGGEMNCGGAGYLVAFLQDAWYYQSR